MRLTILDRGHRRRARVFMRVARLVTGHQIDAVAQVSLYRPAFFGQPMLDFGSEVLRGQSYWTPAEREYIAAYTSRLNDCPFCARIHTETTRVESRGQLDANDPAAGRPELSAVLPLVEKVTRSPDEIGRADIDAVRAAGVPDDAIVDALAVCLVFNLMNRLANSFDMEWDSDEHVRMGARVIHRINYRLPGFLLR
jgi:uncharacterized peroxidase-related enzyme